MGKVTVKIDVNGIINKQKQILKGRINKFAKYLKQKVDEKTPEKTKELIGNTQIGEIIEVGDKVGVSVYNDTDYAIYVENGVIGKDFNYQKPKGIIFYNGEGAGMFTITFEEEGDKFNKMSK